MGEGAHSLEVLPSVAPVPFGLLSPPRWASHQPLEAR